MEPWKQTQNPTQTTPRGVWVCVGTGGIWIFDFGSGNTLLASQVEFHWHCQEQNGILMKKKPETHKAIMMRVGQQDSHQKMTLENTVSF